MENSHSMMMIMKQALHIPFKNPRFMIFLIFTSLPLLVFTIVYEMMYQLTILETAKISLCDDHVTIGYNFFSYCSPIGSIDRLINVVSPRLLLLFLFYLGVVNTICIVDAASVIHRGENTMNLKEMIYKFRTEARFRGPLITSLYSLFLVSLVFSGLTSLAAYTFIVSDYLLFVILFGGAFVALLVKYIEWSAVWNMAAVISILEEKEGDVAFVISSYLSRGSRQQGIVYSLVFLSWSLASRLAFFCLGWFGGEEGSGIMAATIHSCVLCLGNTIKWLVFTVYYYDCKRRSEEKKRFDVGKTIADEPVAV